MIKVLEKEACCGCGACEQVCKKKCITLKSDKEGFWYPKVNTDICVNCNRCNLVCPYGKINTSLNCERECETFVAYTTDSDIRKRSSSGGIFTLLAEEIIRCGGYVFGAAFDENFLVHHINVNSEIDLYLLRGSKYLQSRIEDSFTQAKTFLDGGKYVLFTGTACQIVALKNYLGRNYEKLYTLDVLCHGVASPKLWRYYLNSQEKRYGGKVQQTFFRQKNFGWKTYALELQFSNSKAYVKTFNDDPYMQMFLADISLRPSCYECKFKEIPRISDITLGDCWGVEKRMPEMDDDKGTSVVVINSQKGMQLWKAIDNRIISKETELDYILPPTVASRKVVRVPSKRIKFFKALDRGKSIHNLVSYIKPNVVIRALNKMQRILHF